MVPRQTAKLSGVWWKIYLQSQKSVSESFRSLSAVGLPSYFGSMLRARAEQVATAKSLLEHLKVEKL